LVLLGQLAQPEQAARALELGAAAAGSPRMSECADASEPDAGARFWRRATAPQLERYCTLLAAGYASLGNHPAGAEQAASAALRLLPGRPGARLLRARANLALGRFSAAFAEFQAIGAATQAALPDALHDFALSAMGSGEYEHAARAYRLLGSRVSLLPGLGRQQRVYIEGAVALMQLGPPALDESIASLQEARQLPAPPGLGAHVFGALALALDRQGQTGQARGVAAEARSRSALERTLAEPNPPATVSQSRRRAFRVAWPMLPAHELHAMLAMLLEGEDPASAAQHWNEFIQAPSAKQSPWLNHAREKLAALEAPRRRKAR
jgi:tetratricopeptide (TPR) repeat protein